MPDWVQQLLISVTALVVGIATGKYGPRLVAVIRTIFNGLGFLVSTVVSLITTGGIMIGNRLVSWIKTIFDGLGFLVSTVVYLITIGFALSFLHQWAAIAVTGILIGVAVFLFVFPFVPNAVEHFANDPNRFADQADENGDYPGSTFGYFTFLAPGHTKMIERGQRFIRAIMRYDNHCWRGELPPPEDRGPYTKKEQEYWGVKKSGEYPDAHPIPYEGISSLINPLFWWARHVYHWTGGVFTGFYPWQTVRIYKNTRLEKKLQKDGSFLFVPVTDWSDHYRVAESQLFVEVPSADTRDKIPVDVKMAFTVRHNNPYLTAYNTDENWSTRFSTAATDGINRFTRVRQLDFVLTADDEDVGHFASVVRNQLNGAELPRRTSAKLKKSLEGTPVVKEFGMEVTEASLLGVETSDPDHQGALAQERTSRSEQTAIHNRGKGRAAANQELIAVARQGGYLGEIVLRNETQIQTAQAMKDSNGTVILDTSSTRDGNVNPSVAFLEQSIRDRQQKGEG